MTWEVSYTPRQYIKHQGARKLRVIVRYRSRTLTTTLGGWLVIVQEVKGANGPEASGRSADWHWIAARGDEIKSGKATSLVIAVRNIKEEIK